MSANDTDKPGPKAGRRRWLCVAYAFPPINRSGTHRTLGFVNHLDRLGWDASVLTVLPRDEPLDESLIREVPDSTSVVRTPWVDRIAQVKGWLPGGSENVKTSKRQNRGVDVSIPARRDFDVSTRGFRDWFSRLLMTPDSRVGWIGPAVRAGLREIKRRRPEVLYSTSPYMSAHLIAQALSRRTGLPWVADFRDPWTFNPFRRIPYSTLRRWDAWLERRVLRSASHVVCCTTRMTQEFLRRFPFLQGKCSTIMNGFDAGLLEGIKPLRDAGRDRFVMTHCGQFYGGRNPAVWFAALRRALKDAPSLAEKVVVQLIGPTTFDGKSLEELAAFHGLADVVRVLGPKSHAESLGYMAGSDALMLAASDGLGGELQVPNKLFEYLAIKRPIIATCAHGNPTVDILADAEAQAVVCEPGDERALANAIAGQALRSLDEPTESACRPTRTWSGVHRFDRAHRAAELANVFERLVGGTSEESIVKSEELLVKTGCHHSSLITLHS